MNYLNYGDYLCHWGVKGQKWGVRKEEDISNGNISNKQPSSVPNFVKNKMIKNESKKVGDTTAAIIAGVGALTIASALALSKSENMKKTMNATKIGVITTGLLSTVGGITASSITKKKLKNNL